MDASQPGARSDLRSPLPAAPLLPGGTRPLARDAEADLGRRARKRRRALLRGVRQALIGLALAAGAVATVWELRPGPVPVDVAGVRRGPLAVTIQESGSTRVKDRYSVSVPVSGSLSRLTLETGDHVREGDALAEIAPALSPLLDERARAEAQARLGAALSALGQTQAQEARAAAARELAAQELARARELSAHASLSRQALEQAEFLERMRAKELASAVFASKVAAEEVRIARVSLGEGEQRAPRQRHVDVLAPASGRVLRVLQKSAGVVQAGTPLLEVGDPEALEVVVDLLTTDAVHIQPGTPVAIEGWGGDQPIAGRVRKVEPSAFTRPSALGIDEQRVNVLIAFSEPRDRWAVLGDGYRVEVRLVLWESDDVIKVPQGAVFRHGSGWATFRIDGDTARRISVGVGHRGESEVEVTSGLAEGDRIAVHPGDRVKDGAHVAAR